MGTETEELNERLRWINAKLSKEVKELSAYTMKIEKENKRLRDAIQRKSKD